MKKYTETKNRKPFDWFEALSKDCSKMTVKESERLAELVHQEINVQLFQEIKVENL
jgi:hypothetical protein